MKKMIALLMAAMMLLSVAAACGKDVTETPVTPADPGVSAPTQPSTPAPETPVQPTVAEKVYRTYLVNDVPLMNAHDYVGNSIATPYEFINSPLFRAVPDDNGISYHYVGDLAADLPQLIETKEGTYTTYSAEAQADGSSKFVAVEETGTLTTYEFKIRDEATWHNGEKLDATDIEYSFKMQIDPVMLNQMSNFLYSQAITILNGEKYFRGDCEWDEVGVKVLEDGQTMQITCVGEPDVNTFCSHFLDRSVYPVYEEYYEAGMSDDRTSTTYGDSVDTWMGCGPYFFSEWEQDNKMVFKKNADHWLADLFNYDAVEIYIIKEQNAAVQMFEAGKLDQLTPDADTIESYVEDPRLVGNPSRFIEHLEINDGSAPIKNEKNPIADTLAWRKAFYHAIDRETIAAQFFGHMYPAGWYVNGMAGLQSSSGLTYRESEWGQKIEQMIADWSAEGHTTGYNPELARQYLQEAYAEKGLPADTKIEVIFLYSNTSYWDKTAQWIDTQFDEIFEGLVDIIITKYPAEMGDTAAKKEYAWDIIPDCWGRSLSGTYPSEAFYYFTAGYSAHPNYYLSERLDTQFEYCRSIQEGPYEELLEATYEADKIFLEDMVLCPVVQDVSFILFADHLELPVKTYIPGFGWGAAYGDIVE